MQPSTIEELQAAVRSAARVLPRGGGTKPALSAPRDGFTTIDMAGLEGIIEYEPGEFTFTALAGTRVVDAARGLARHGQYLPFDPILADSGSTLGGTVAAGTSGPGRYRYGGIRDFLIGIRFVDSEGNLVRSGGKVVKNAAGFDLSKLMVGSLGRLGVLAELTFKVFPQPLAYATVRANYRDLADALARLEALASSQMELDALDLEPTLEGCTLWARLGGLPDALPPRLARLAALLGPSATQPQDEARFWRDAVEMAWAPQGWALVKVPLTTGRIPAFDAACATASNGDPHILRRYSAGGQVAWVALRDEDLAWLDVSLSELGLAGLVIFGAPERPRLGRWNGQALAQRVHRALDPVGRFEES